MRIALAHTKPCKNQYLVYDALREGLKLHGDEAINLIGFDSIKKIPEYDAVVMISYPDIVELGYKFCDGEPHEKRDKTFWSMINVFRGEIYKKCLESKKRMLCIDSGVIGYRRGQNVGDNYYQVGWDSIKGLGKYYNSNSPSDRWEKLGKTLEPMNYDGGYVVVFGQVRYGVGSQHRDIKMWYRETINKVLDITQDHKILLRLHPNVDDPPFPAKHKNVKFSSVDSTFEDDVKKAFCTISFSSHSIVQAVLMGKPSFCTSRVSMGYPLFKIDDVSDIFTKRLEMPSREETLQWLYDLSYTQWSVGELRDGSAWNFLRPNALKVEDVRFDDMLCKL